MKLRTCLLATGLSLAYAGLALGAVSADKAAQLGKNLTLVGAEKAGNKEGTIPEYTGGISKSPANYTKKGWRPDPFEGEKPQFSISAKNMAQYNDKLSEGVKAMLKKYPTFRLDVYKTHRTAAYPKYVTDNTVKHAPLTPSRLKRAARMWSSIGTTPFATPFPSVSKVRARILSIAPIMMMATAISMWASSRADWTSSPRWMWSTRRISGSA